MNNKIAIVTGAAKGIGKEISKMLANNNYKVIVNYKKSIDDAEKLKKENENIDIFKADVSKRSEVKEMVNYAIEKYGKIDVLINNAGISESKMFTDVTDEDWNKIITNNLYSAFCTTQEVLPHMIHSKSGCIINISSVWGVVGASCESVYAISKAGINGMTKSLAKELGPSNIRVNAIAPGFINTDMNKDLSDEDAFCIKQNTPLQKVGEPVDIARCVKWLVEDQFTTGQIISVNGGWFI